MIFESFCSPEANIFGIYIPWVVPVTFMGFLCAAILVDGLERINWTRFIWHLPLFLIAAAVFFSCLIGIICSL